MKPVDVKDNTYIDKVNDKDPKFKVGDLVRSTKYKNIFAKGYSQNWSEEVFVIKQVKNTVPCTMISMMKKLLEHFMKKKYKRLIKKNLGQKKQLKKGDKLYVKWKGYNSSFNSWIDKKDLIKQVRLYYTKNESIFSKTV